MGCGILELAVGQAIKYNTVGLKPMKKLLYTWFGNCYAIFGLSKFLGHMYALWR